MPKLKTRKAVKKRMKITKTGKAKASKAFRGHLLSGKTRKRKRHLRLKVVVPKKNAKKFKDMIH
jgi:large subunit ribosomal protein L35